MSPPDQGSRAEGVGIAYHPFLHDALLTGSFSPDFVELPMDLYLDPARAALLDPADGRLDEIIGAHRCVWRGTALSLGSVGPTADLNIDPRLIRRIRRLLQKSAAAHYTDVIGFRRVGADDLGTPQHMPRTETAARWIAARQRSASEALGVPVLLQLAPSPAPPGGWDEASFVHRIAAAAGCEFVLDAADPARMAATSGNDVERMLGALPNAHITVATIGRAGEADWAKLSLIAERANLHSIVLRRDRNLFPLDTIASDVGRAAQILRRSRAHVSAPPRSAPPPLALGAEELAALRAYQSAFIDYIGNSNRDRVPPALAHMTAAERDAFMALLGNWRNWHAQVTDIHKARQMAAFLSPRTGPPGSY